MRKGRFQPRGAHPSPGLGVRGPAPAGARGSSSASQPAPPVPGPSPALPAALTAWKRGRRGEGREAREAAWSRGRPHALRRDPTAKREPRAALPRAGDGVRCPRPGAHPEPRGRGRRDAAARDPQPTRGGGFRPGRAAAASERPGPRASVPGASATPGPRRPPLCPSDSLPRSGPAAVVAGLPAEWFCGPQRGETCPNSGAP